MSRAFLEESCRDGMIDACRKSQAASDAYERMRDKETPYARAIKRMAEVHQMAADVYAKALVDGAQAEMPPPVPDSDSNPMHKLGYGRGDK